MVPNIISERTKIENKPAPILLGDHSIIMLDGIKKNRERIKRKGNIDTQDENSGNAPKASENINDVNKVTNNP